MAVKDSPKTKVKAADAQRFMAIKDPLDASQRLTKLIARHDLRAAVAIVTANQRQPMILSLAPGDKEGGKLLQYWADRTVPNLPPLDDAAVLVGIRKDGWIDTATWGVDVHACAMAGRWAGDLADNHLYHVPFQTWFGFGKGGVPTCLSEAQLATLSDNSRDWAAKGTHPEAVDPS